MATALKILCDEILGEGLKAFGMELGIVSRVDSGIYHVIAVLSKTGAFVSGETFALEETFCRDVIASKATLALTEIDGVKGLRQHPLYMPLSLEAYISSPIWVEGHVWGTINFSSMDIREDPFGDDDRKLNENYAQRIAEAVEAMG